MIGDQTYKESAINSNDAKEHTDQLPIDILIGLEKVHPLGVRERVFVDGLKEGLSKTLVGEEFLIDDVSGVNVAPSKSFPPTLKLNIVPNVL
ncbi:hypothetical protein Tco_0471430 [Tanacetum coccineum]